MTHEWGNQSIIREGGFEIRVANFVVTKCPNLLNPSVIIWSFR